MPVVTLRTFLDSVEAQLDVAEPILLDDGCCIANMAPIQGGLVGLDLETGKPVRVGGQYYKNVDEKPVIFNNGSEQIVIPPLPPPQLPALPPLIDVVMAGELYDAMRAQSLQSTHWTEADVQAKQAFVLGCLTNPSFYLEHLAAFDILRQPQELPVKPVPSKRDWPRPEKVRRRAVDI